MTNSTQIMESVVQTLLARGLDFIVEEARSFVETNRLNKRLSPNQMSSLRAVYERHSDVFETQKKKVSCFIKAQREKDEKQNGNKWSVVGNSLCKRIFEFSEEEREKVRKQVERLLKERGLYFEYEHDLTDIFNISESKEWIESKLEPLLSRKMFVAIFTVYRCKKAGLSIPKLEE